MLFKLYILILFFLTTFYLLFISHSLHNIWITTIFSLAYISIIIYLFKYINYKVVIIYGVIVIIFPLLFVAYNTGFINYDLYSNFFSFAKLVGGFDEIARSYKETSKLIIEYFKTGIVSDELRQAILSIPNYSELNYYKNNQYLFMNFSLKNFMFQYFHYFYFVLIGYFFFVYLFKSDLKIINIKY